MAQDSLKQLHHLATTGATLTDEERKELDDWYAQQDHEEHLALSLGSVDTDLESLKTQVEAALAQLLVATKRMQDLVAENDNLRRDLAFLRQQLIAASTLQTA